MTTNTFLDDFLTTDVTAKELDVKTGTLTNWRFNRCGPAYHKIGNRIFYHPNDVKAWISGRRVPPETST